LDENLGLRVQAVLRSAGYDAATVLDEGLGGATDPALWEVCQAEGRCLITLDLDFAQVLRFPPAESAGIVVLRPGARIQPATIASLALQVVDRIEEGFRPWGRLWVVEPGRVRVHE
jgi:predicted nuclease of predicted toxin-antitoxin system